MKKLKSNCLNHWKLLQLLKWNNKAIEDLDLNLAQRLVLAKYLSDEKEGSSESPAEGMATSTNPEPCIK